MSVVEKTLDRAFKKKVIINCEKDPYLHRWYLIKTPWLGVFVHKFVRSDEDRALHDHPWPFLVIPIWRGYIEHSDRRRQCWLCDDGCGHLPEDIFGPGKVCSECKGTGWLDKSIERRVYPILGTRLRPATYRHRVELTKHERMCPECFPNIHANKGLISALEYSNCMLHRQDCKTCHGKALAKIEQPAWSLFIRFKRIREWGFWPKTGWVSWKQWWNDLCED